MSVDTFAFWTPSGSAGADSGAPPYSCRVTQSKAVQTTLYSTTVRLWPLHPPSVAHWSCVGWSLLYLVVCAPPPRARTLTHAAPRITRGADPRSISLVTPATSLCNSYRTRNAHHPGISHRSTAVCSAVAAPLCVMCGCMVAAQEGQSALPGNSLRRPWRRPHSLWTGRALLFTRDSKPPISSSA